MISKKLSAAIILVLCLSSTAHTQPLIEPRLTIKPGPTRGPYVALTFDACSGHVDERILQALIDNHIRATIFATARWLKRNPQVIKQIKEHSDLFEVENHGATHVPAVDFPIKVFGLASAASSRAVYNEVVGGEEAIMKAFGHKAKWFRGAAGLYTASSMKQIVDMNLKVAGYSVLGDGGASFSAAKTAKVIGAAKDGDVIVAHINQPKKPAGAGVVEGILKLQKAGFIFLRLQDGV